MAEEKKVSRCHRLCPCSAKDIEGIQSWLEDMAQEGLLLERDSVFCGLWSFEKTAPRKALYRLEVIRGKFMEDTDAPREEIVETAGAMGWEYVTRYGTFYIYRSFDPAARPLHTDPALQAMTVKFLRRRCWSDLIWNLLYVIFLFFLSSSAFGQLFRITAAFGYLCAAGILGLLVVFLLRPGVGVYYLHRAIRRLRTVGALDTKRPWRQKASLWIAARILPMILLACTVIPMLVGLAHSTNTKPLEEYTGDAPFVSIQQLYPEATIRSRTVMGDYNTFLYRKTAAAENTQWTESGELTLDGKRMYFILRLNVHETDGQWLAKGLFRDYYYEDSHRYNGKRFLELEAPELSVDALRVYSSYGIRYILLRQGNVVIHGTVQLREGENTDRWEDWLTAMEAKLQSGN